MGFLVRIEAVERVSEYRGQNQNGDDYCIASWKVKNVVDGTQMLVSCFTKEDDLLKTNGGIPMDGTLTIVCRDWSKNGKSGTMNNVTLSNLVGPEKPSDLPDQQIPPAVANNIFDPSANNDLPF